MLHVQKPDGLHHMSETSIAAVRWKVLIINKSNAKDRAMQGVIRKDGLTFTIKRESNPAARRASEELPEQEADVGGTCGGETPSLLRPEDDVFRARAEIPSQSIPDWTSNHPTRDDLYWAIPPASGSAGTLAAYVGII
ncbi:hypothetical protein E2C01_034984 [Portunus trituberculatus]|uniref:Uncharacterized protein n=1 Tax=Portunus trituberculatus TaxID=210409 RepID=A0A5B7FA92_PORTR|nr:hypothetical protein [Portunus trituberculatus]